MTLKRCLIATTPVRKMIRIEICLVKFPHSPILHYAFSSWIEKTMTKTIHCHWENRFVLQYGAVRKFYPPFEWLHRNRSYCQNWNMFEQICLSNDLNNKKSVVCFYNNKIQRCPSVWYPLILTNVHWLIPTKIATPTHWRFLNLRKFITKAVLVSWCTMKT